MNNLVDLADLEPGDIERIYRKTTELKTKPDAFRSALAQKTLLMLFAKPSTRTRVSFEAGMTQLGGHGIYFAEERSQLSRGESLKDTAHVLSRYVDGIMARLFDHTDLLALAEHADVPVINGLTDQLHPCQALADLYTLQEHGFDPGETTVVYMGDGNNVSHSLMHACALLGSDFVFSGPEGHDPDPDIVTAAQNIAKENGGSITTVRDPYDAVAGADVLYTDVWVSMGDEAEAEERINNLQSYQVNEKLVAAADNPVIMHPLPAHRGQEITSPVLDAPQSIVYDQAENRLHVQKAVLLELLA